MNYYIIVFKNTHDAMTADKKLAMKRERKGLLLYNKGNHQVQISKFKFQSK